MHPVRKREENEKETHQLMLPVTTSSKNEKRKHCKANVTRYKTLLSWQKKARGKKCMIKKRKRERKIQIFFFSPNHGHVHNIQKSPYLFH